MGIESNKVKRILDLVLVVLAIPLLILPILILALLVRCNFGSPIFFRQQRAGLHGKPFELVKFRTMIDIRGPDGAYLPDSQRLTRLGKVLRSTSLDELPELWNVFKGEMSLVGPRPLLMEYLPLYTNEQTKRHNALPGITGWAQINGRNTLNWEEKFNLDIWYVKNQSLWLDLKILFITMIKVLRRDGISGNGEVTMKKFTGSNS